MRHGRSRRKPGKTRKTRKPQQAEKRKPKAERIKASIAFQAPEHDLTCGRIGCENPAAWRPEITFEAENDEGRKRGMLIMNVEVCDEHRDPDLSLYINDAGWDALEKHLDEIDKAKPDRTSARVEFARIQGERRFSHEANIHRIH
ncbi:MAG: hypothetical protein RKO66_11980 [Candidatus Contendobacter sp.]|nr:hypothetical protein [Candidatus Contendobacter sp.]MDS4059658.1 hypothetical protein [Candidatus Contendobacter sp.]